MREFSDDIMDSVNAWYIRKNGEIKGPFARGLLLRHRVLGRLRAEDEVSIDRINWFLAMEIPALDPNAAMPMRITRQSSDGLEWSQERERARKRWMEERWRGDRKQPADDPEELEQEQRRRATQSTPGPRDILPSSLSNDLTPGRSAVIAVSVIVILLLAAWLMNRYEDKSPLSIRLMPSASSACGAAAQGATPALGCEARESR